MRTMKKFDCLKMKDEAQRQRVERLRGLSAEARLEFYRQAHEALIRRQKQLQECDEPAEARPATGVDGTHTTADDT